MSSVDGTEVVGRSNSASKKLGIAAIEVWTKDLPILPSSLLGMGYFVGVFGSVHEEPFLGDTNVVFIGVLSSGEGMVRRCLNWEDAGRLGVYTTACMTM